MAVNLIKLCVGIDDVPHLARVQRQRLDRLREAGEALELQHITRSFPRRKEEVLDGGSLYWVIKGVIRVRQRILDLREAVNQYGKPACAIVYDPEHIETERRTFRAFQGWRYLKMEDAPRDLKSGDRGDDALPDDLALELKELGLL